MSSKPPKRRYATLCVEGMTCASCELLLERKLKAIPGIVEVTIDHRTGIARIAADARSTPSGDAIASVIHEAGYSLVDEETPTIATVAPGQRKWMEIGGSLLVIFALFKLLQIFDLVSLAPSTTGTLTFGGIFLIGIIAGTSSCLAVTGGLLFALAAKRHEVSASKTPWEKFQPHLHFNVGRLASYFVLGGLVGLLGQVLTPSAKVTGFMNITVSLLMLYLALTILEIIPKGSCPIRLPKRLSHWIAGLSESRNPSAPLGLGALTFFLPCGFTQSLQLVALASGDFLQGGLIMFTFALGTLPSLLGISAFSSFTKGTGSRLFLRFSGSLVLLLALFSLNTGLTLTGFRFQALLRGPAPAAALAPTVTGVQEVSMRVGRFGYEPSNPVIRAGVPVRLTIDGTEARGCMSVFTIPDFGITKFLAKGPTVVEFTPPSQPGILGFSCGMGMAGGFFSLI